MKGRIKRYINKKGYGFITGEDGQDYFFHISQFKDMVEPQNYMFVEFDIVDGKRGKNAVNIATQSPVGNNRSKVINFGNKNIRVNNIKEYGIVKCFGYLEEYGFNNSPIREISESEYNRHKVYYDNLGDKIVKCGYLYIKTYQKEYMRFYQDHEDFDIFEKYNEINNAMQYGH